MKRLPASATLAMASLVSLGAQAMMGVAMLHFFSPEATGRFAVIAQVAFFWVTLALAQGPLTFLADVQQPPGQALRAVLRASLARWGLLLPLVGAAVWLGAMAQPLAVLGWAGLLALLQMLGYLAQPWALRTATPTSAALARALPPLLALALAAGWSALHGGDGASGLLVAAAGGYALGALWLRPAKHHTQGSAPAALPAAQAPRQGDQRSAWLRMAHTTMDAVTGTALLLIWQRLHGVAEASYLAVLLRLLGFVPTIVHAAWAQVLLARRETAQGRSVAIGLGAALATGLVGLAGAALLDMGLLADGWRGLRPYLLPLVLWQSSACLFAALSHRPFQQGRERRYSHLAIAFDALQLLVLTLPLLGAAVWSPTEHLWWLAGVSSTGLLALSLWMAGIKLK